MSGKAARSAAVSARLLAAVAVLLGACSSSRETTSTLDRVQRRGELLVCSTGDYRPYTYLDPAGAWSGIDIDMAGELARALGVRVHMVPTTWTTLTDDFRASCDIAVGGVTISPERAEVAAFSAPYQTDGKTPITRCAAVDRFRTLAQIDQPGVRAVVNPGGTNERYARANLTRATIVEHRDNNTIFQQLIDGRADLMITDAVEARWQANQHPELCAVHPDQPFTHAEKAYLLPKGDVAFRRRVDAWLGRVLRDGTFARISRAWIG